MHRHQSCRIHRGEHWTKPAQPARTLPLNFERHVFAETRTTAYRLAA
jgi:hypothetical protein